MNSTPALSTAGVRRLLRLIRYRRLGQKWGGPVSVLRYLEIGLRRAGIQYERNPSRLGPLVGVLGDVDALRWAISESRKGRVRRIVAGPNLMILPTDHGGVLGDVAVDRVIVPAPWVVDVYLHHMPSLAGRLAVWPVGVDEEYWTAGEDSVERRDVLIYPKLHPPALLERLRIEVERRGLSVTVLDYGRHSYREYRELLRRHRWMAFLSESESQGIALLEAWSCNVPTLVWDRRQWRSGDYVWDGASSAPYFTDETGVSFKGMDDLANAIDQMETRAFAPRSHVMRCWRAADRARSYVELFSEA